MSELPADSPRRRVSGLFQHITTGRHRARRAGQIDRAHRALLAVGQQNRDPDISQPLLEGGRVPTSLPDKQPVELS